MVATFFIHLMTGPAGLIKKGVCMRIIKRGASEAHLSYKEWRARVLRSQTIFPEIRYIPEISKNSKVNNPLSAARGSFFNRKDKIGQERFDETTPPREFHGNSAA